MTPRTATGRKCGGRWEEWQSCILVVGHDGPHKAATLDRSAALREALERISHGAFDSNDECRYCRADVEDEHDDRCPCLIADAALLAKQERP